MSNSARFPQDHEEEFSKLDWQLVARPQGQRDAQWERCPEMKEEIHQCFPTRVAHVLTTLRKVMQHSTTLGKGVVSKLQVHP